MIILLAAFNNKNVYKIIKLFIIYEEVGSMYLYYITLLIKRQNRNIKGSDHF
jgi:hypothetical protein